mmetsp:Transcript_14633/g.35299  ORF Transcript_14633/g.35299 Transcript_14633/m.35299 type:complete len:206 (+) Transcript_14633:514-1131(+)
MAKVLQPNWGKLAFFSGQHVSTLEWHFGKIKYLLSCTDQIQRNLYFHGGHTQCGLHGTFLSLDHHLFSPISSTQNLSMHMDLRKKTARSFCQIALPVGAQFVASPLHYIGLDLYNRNLGSMSWRESMIDRSKSLYRGVLPVTIARIARIAPGYGFAGVFNTKLREDWREYLLEREVEMMMETPKKEYASRMVALVHHNTRTKRLS